jgi:hypothetical protein
MQNFSFKDLEKMQIVDFLSKIIYILAMNKEKGIKPIVKILKILKEQ